MGTPKWYIPQGGVVHPEVVGVRLGGEVSRRRWCSELGWVRERVFFWCCVLVTRKYLMCPCSSLRRLKKYSVLGFAALRDRLVDSYWGPICSEVCRWEGSLCDRLGGSGRLSGPVRLKGICPFPNIALMPANTACKVSNTRPAIAQHGPELIQP